MVTTSRAILSFLICLTVRAGFSHGNPDTLRVLFVGNSYTFVSNIPHLVSLISDSTNIKLITSKSTIGGARLSEHWKGERGLKTKELIQDGHFDIVVLQEQSMGTIQQPDSFLIYSRKFSEFIRKNGGEPFFYSTWSREKVPQHQEIISNIYKQAAEENHAGLVPVGDAWALARKYRPNIELYIQDGSHPSTLGAFLAACVFVKTFTNEIPSNLPNGYSVLDENGESILLMFLDSLDITFCLLITEEVSK